MKTRAKLKVVRKMRAGCGKRKGCFITELPHLGSNKIKKLSKIAA